MHIYNLVEKAQGPMVCDLDVSLDDHAIVLEDDRSDYLPNPYGDARDSRGGACCQH